MAIVERAITLPFSIDETGSISSSNDQAKIWQSRVTAVVMTEVGERIFRPQWGGNVKDSLFQPTPDALLSAEASVRESFNKYLPNLVLNNVSSAIDQQEGVLSLTINYTLPSQAKAQVVLTTAALTRSGDITQEY